MGARLINWALDNRFLVLMLLVLLIVFGGVALVRLPIDAVPDVTNVQVQIMTTAPALAAEETEQFITFPVENSLSGIPKVEEIRSVSQFGLSVVTVVFEEGTDIFWARQQIGERLLELGLEQRERRLQLVRCVRAETRRLLKRLLQAVQFSYTRATLADTTTSTPCLMRARL